MEQVLKERLVGAVVLVGTAVLLIPELLSGRKPTTAPDDSADGARTYTIELQPPTAGEPASTTTGPVAPAAERSAALKLPAPGAETVPEDAAQAPQDSAAEANPAPSPASPPGAAVDDAQEPPAPGGVAVQVGAFGSESAAKRMLQELQSKGYDAYLSPVERGGKTLQRVRVGPARDAATAAATADRLKQQGYASAVVVGT